MTAQISPPRAARLELFTHKRGLLAAVGHDLCLAVDELAIELAAGRIQARFDLASLRVRGAMRSGALNASEPSESDRRSILDAVRREILQSDRHPRAELDAQLSVRGQSAEARGELALHGRTQPLVLSFALDARASQLRIRTELQPSRWGIAPYRALGGALKLEDRVSVALDLDVDAALLADPLAASARWAART